MSLLVKKDVNTLRQIEADIAKMICLIGMVFVHCFEEMNTGTQDATVAEYIFVTVLDCLFGASTFMFCMGFGIAYSRNSTPGGLIKRGAQIFLFSYILNIVRYTLPMLLAYALSGNQEPLNLSWTWFTIIDIMQFAGLALMLFGLLKKLKLSQWGIAAVAVLMSVLGSFVRDFDMGSLALNQTIGLFFGTVSGEHDGDTLAFFPLFNWFIFVAAGYIFALFLRRCENKNRFYAIVSPAAAALVVLYMLVAIPNRMGMMGEDFNKFYHMATPEALVCAAAAVAVLGMYYAFSKLLGEKVKALITNISGNINRIYCIHWTILGWVWYPYSFSQDVYELPDWEIFCFGAVLFVVSVIAADIYTKMKKKRHASREAHI